MNEKTVWITETVICDDGYIDDQTEPECIELTELTSVALWSDLTARAGIKDHLCVSHADIRTWLETAIAEAPEVTTSLTVAKIQELDAIIDLDLHFGTEADAYFGADTLVTATEPEMDQLELIDYLEGVS